MADQRYWVWVFGEIGGLRWVVDRGEMAFPASASARIAHLGRGDRAVLYVTRGAFHNPSRDRAHLAGLVRVDGPAEKRRAVSIAGRTFALRCPFTPELLLPERHGPAVHALAPRLDLVRQPQHWGQYFRTSPIAISRDDYDLFAREIRSWAARHAKETV